FCIDRGIRRFEGGAQGEHKLARGLLPVSTYSAHWVGDPDFDRPVRQFVDRESKMVLRHVNELEEHAPFKDAPEGPTLEI
ncbi:MAG: N-acetyltransferase, partial [Burkholderiales bacterium]|nr:N-acetyltransferase [Burkholderiales bacterium]